MGYFLALFASPSPDGLAFQAAAQASSCLQTLDVRSARPDGFAYRKIYPERSHTP